MTILRARYIGYLKDTENHGDEALLWIIRALLAPEIVLTEGDDFELALLGGGTLINQSPWLIDWFGESLDRAQYGAVLGSGVGDLTFWGNHFDRWKPLLDRCNWVGVRGPDSLALLHEHGVAHATMIGDPYLWLRSPVRRTAVPRLMGVNLGLTNNALLGGGGDEAFIDYMTETLRELRAAGWSFVFLSVWSKDLPVACAVRDAVQPDAPVFDARAQTLEAYAALAGCEVFLGEKLHACAMAAVAGIPFVALEYQPKVRDFAGSVGMARHVISTAARDPAALAERLEQIRSDRAVQARRLNGRLRTARGRLTRFVRRLKGDLKCVS